MTTASAPAVAITGMGLTSPAGLGVAAFERALRDGTPPVPSDDPALHSLFPAGVRAPLLRVGDTGVRAFLPAARLRRTPRVAQLALSAAHEALGRPPAGAPPPILDRYDPDRVAVVLGTGLGNLEQTADFTLAYLRGGPEDASPALFPVTVMNATAGFFAMEWQLRGPNITVNHRDLSLAEALACARDQLLLGRADAVLCGGFDELGPWTAHSYQRFGALSSERARPYDRRRDGVALGECGAVFLLEREADARACGADILGRLIGVGRGGDDRPRVGYLCPGSEPGDGAPTRGAVTAIRAALAQASVTPAALSLVLGGGDGGPVDALETAVLREALGAAADTVPVSSPLALCGASMAAAGPRLCAALLARRSSVAPATVGCEDPDPQAALPGLCRAPRPLAPGPVLLPVLAMGGGCVALVIDSA